MQSCPQNNQASLGNHSDSSSSASLISYPSSFELEEPKEKAYEGGYSHLEKVYLSIQNYFQGFKTKLCDIGSSEDIRAYQAKYPSKSKESILKERQLRYIQRASYELPCFKRIQNFKNNFLEQMRKDQDRKSQHIADFEALNHGFIADLKRSGPNARYLIENENLSDNWRVKDRKHANETEDDVFENYLKRFWHRLLAFCDKNPEKAKEYHLFLGQQILSDGYQRAFEFFHNPHLNQHLNCQGLSYHLYKKDNRVILEAKQELAFLKSDSIEDDDQLLESLNTAKKIESVLKVILDGTASDQGRASLRFRHLT